jgi:hypothetical protein
MLLQIVCVIPDSISVFCKESDTPGELKTHIVYHDTYSGNGENALKKTKTNPADNKQYDIPTKTANDEKRKLREALYKEAFESCSVDPVVSATGSDGLKQCVKEELCVGGDEEATSVEENAGDLISMLDGVESRKADERDGKESYMFEKMIECTSAEYLDKDTGDLKAENRDANTGHILKNKISSGDIQNKLGGSCSPKKPGSSQVLTDKEREGMINRRMAEGVELIKNCEDKDKKFCTEEVEEEMLFAGVNEKRKIIQKIISELEEEYMLFAGVNEKRKIIQKIQNSRRSMCYLLECNTHFGHR